MDQRSFYKAFYTNFLLFLSFLSLLFSISTWSSPSFDGARIRAQAPSSFLFVYPRPFFGLSLPVIHLWYIITASLSYYSTKMPSLGLLLVWNMCKMWMFLFCHLIARPSTPDFLGKVGLNLERAKRPWPTVVLRQLTCKITLDLYFLVMLRRYVQVSTLNISTSAYTV